MTRVRPIPTSPAQPVLLVLCLGLVTTAAFGQGAEFDGSPVADVKVEGLKKVNPDLVRNQIRQRKGTPYDSKVVSQDIIRINHLGRFGKVRADIVKKPDGSVILTYVLTEQNLLSDVQVVGNNEVSDQELLTLVVLRGGDPIDEFLINRGVTEIKKAYRQRGYYLTDVTVDKKLLNDSGILIYRVIEGPLVQIRDIRFRGNKVFDDDQLLSQIRSRTAIFIFRKGELSRVQLDQDVARLRTFYRNRGYLEAQVARRILLSDNQKDANVVFFIEEGQQFTIDTIKVEGNKKFPERQVKDIMNLHEGDVFAENLVRRSQSSITELYGKRGHLDTEVKIDRLFHEREPKVNLAVAIKEGPASKVGNIFIRGNSLTKDKVIQRQIRGNFPGRVFDRAGIATTRRRLTESSLFSEAKITVLGDPGDEYRDILIEVKEANTGRINFGAGISSDAGVIGAIDLSQRNFDIADWPDSLGEFFSGRGFRGAGQSFQIALQPGDDFSRYSVSFREPYLLNTDFFFDTNLRYFTRVREDWDEERFGGTMGIGQRFGDVWSGRISIRAENVNVNDVEIDAPVDAFAVEGENNITSLGFTLTRSTTDSRIFPTRGSKLSFGVSRAGALGGEFDFTSLSASYQKFWTVDEDFLGRKTVLSLRVSTAWIAEDGEAPLFERFYAGGHRTFRGFAFRGVGPRGVQANTGRVGDDPVGGDFLFLAGMEYNWPIFQDIIRGVVFVDTGTVEEDIGFDDYRVAVGAGLRIKIPFLGQAPFALDFAVPIVKADGDEEQFFSFDLALPIR